MTVIILIAGLILELAGKHWFQGATTVGTILIIVGAVGIALQLVFSAVALAKVNKVRKEIRSGRAHPRF